MLAVRCFPRFQAELELGVPFLVLFVPFVDKPFPAGRGRPAYVQGAFQIAGG
jgi:hypothetical protein